MDCLTKENADIFRVELHTIDKKLLVFTSLAYAIDYIGRTRPIVYKLDVIEGDMIHTLVSAVDSEEAYRNPQTGEPAPPKVVDLITRKPIA